MSRAAGEQTACPQAREACAQTALPRQHRASARSQPHSCVRSQRRPSRPRSLSSGSPSPPPPCLPRPGRHIPGLGTSPPPAPQPRAVSGACAPSQLLHLLAVGSGHPSPARASVPALKHGRSDPCLPGPAGGVGASPCVTPPCRRKPRMPVHATSSSEKHACPRGCYCPAPGHRQRGSEPALGPPVLPPEPAAGRLGPESGSADPHLGSGRPGCPWSICEVRPG